MVRSVDTFFIDGESFISYCSDSDFDYAIYIGQKCKVLRNEKCFIGTLYKVNSNKNTFSIKQNNGELSNKTIKINTSFDDSDYEIKLICPKCGRTYKADYDTKDRIIRGEIMQ